MLYLSSSPSAAFEPLAFCCKCNECKEKKERD
jgi:hypothetical protein